MNRREAIFGLIKTAGFALAAPALSFAEISPPEVPYGTDRLENTEPAKLSASIRSQLKNAGLPVPLTFEPFPGPDWLAARSASPDIFDIANSLPPFFSIFIGGFNFFAPKDEYATPREIVGTSPQSTDLKDYGDFFTTDFKKLPACEGFRLSQKAWNADTALHESIHYALFNLNQYGRPLQPGEISLGDYVFSVVNKLDPPQERGSYISSLGEALKKHPKNRALKDKLEVANATFFQLHERMADAGAALYALSNYTDRKSTIDYYKTLADVREAYFTDERHPTTTSIRAAVKSFSEDSRKGVSIVDAAIWASNIVARQPEFTKSIAEMARDFREIERANQHLKMEKPYARYSIEHRQEGEIYRSVISARQRLCSAFDLSMK